MGGQEGELLGAGAANSVCMTVWLANSETGVGAAAVPLTSFKVPGTAPNNLYSQTYQTRKKLGVLEFCKHREPLRPLPARLRSKSEVVG